MSVRRMGTILLTFTMVFAAIQGAAPRVLERTEPVYPVLARVARVDGAVKLSVSVGPDGAVRDVKVTSGHPLLNDAAIQAARQWRFTATPAGGVTDIAISFELPATASIAGRIEDPEGRPIAGIRVERRTVVYRGGHRSWNQLSGVVTDENGIYRMTGLQPGEYYIVASHTVPANAAQDGVHYSPLTYYPGTPDGFAAVPVIARVGVEAVADIRLPVMETVAISGKVIVPPLDQPVRVPLQVRFLRLDPQFGNEPAAVAAPPMRDDSTEAPFSIGGLRPGIYELSASVAVGPPNWAYFGRFQVDASRRSVEDVTLTLRRNTEFLGRVIAMDSSIRLSALHVGLLSRDYPYGGGFFDVEADGTFRAFNLAEGDYDLQMTGLPANAYVRNLQVGSSNIFAEGVLPVTIPPPEGFQIVVAADGGQIEGRVENLVREGVPAHVFLVPDASHRQNPILYRDVKSGAAGTFEIRGVAPGDYKLFAFEDEPPTGAVQSAEFIAAYETRGQRVTLRGGVVVPVTLQIVPAP